jgi:vacuolar iron transporter family protein
MAVKPVLAKMVGNKTRRVIIGFQKNEITEFLIYSRLASLTKGKNSEILRAIAQDEKRHYGIWKKFTNVDVRPDRFKLWKYTSLSRIFGLTFGLKLMESGEKGAQKAYSLIGVPGARKVLDDEESHESKLLALLDEEMLKYVGSIVLGLNDALVELTGALAGFTFALQNTQMIAFAGSITGIAASLSMAAAEYLSTKAEGGQKSPLRSSVYTGIAYVITVLLLIMPYLVFSNMYVALATTLAAAIAIIAVFNFYISVAKGLSFAKRFFEMAGISLGVALLTFLLAFAIRQIFGIQL